MVPLFFIHSHTVLKAQFINGLSQKNTVAFYCCRVTLYLGHRPRGNERGAESS